MGTRFARGAGSSRRCALLMLDIDHFRDINANFGPHGGDEAIRAAAAAFLPAFREGEVGARLSGDEFAVFLPNGGIDRALELGETMRLAAVTLRLELPALKDGRPKTAAMTVSIGIAASPDHAASPEELVAAADRALYKAKEGGRNRVTVAPPAC